MKALSKVIFALCVSLFLMVPLATAQTTGDPEIKQIMIAAKTYAKSAGGTEERFEFKFTKRVGDYALVRIYPKPKIKAESDNIVLKKISGKWVGQDMGTGPETGEICPDLFR